MTIEALLAIVKIQNDALGQVISNRNLNSAEVFDILHDARAHAIDMLEAMKE